MTSISGSVGTVADEQRYTHRFQHIRTRSGQVLYGQFGKGKVCVWSVVYTSDREGAFDILSGVTTVCLCLSHFGGVYPECPLHCSALPRVVRRAVY